jgi:predicted nucleic acid-binding protein
MIKAFLDTSVILDALRGGRAAGLLAPDLSARISYVTNPIVLQELLLTAERTEPITEKLDEVLDRSVKVEPLPSSLLEGRHRERLTRLRNSAAHSNDLLLMSSADAAHCDYLITFDQDLLTAARGETFRTVTPDEFLQTIGAAA